MSLISRLAVLLACLVGPIACTTASAGGGSITAPLEDTYWQLAQVANHTIQPGIARREPYLQLHPDKGRYSATAGCNGLGGTYVLSGKNLLLTPGISTRMYCEGPVGHWESALGQAFHQTVSWLIEGQTLYLLDESGTEAARFKAGAPR